MKFRALPTWGAPFGIPGFRQSPSDRRLIRAPRRRASPSVPPPEGAAARRRRARGARKALLPRKVPPKISRTAFPLSGFFVLLLS